MPLPRRILVLTSKYSTPEQRLVIGRLDMTDVHLTCDGDGNYRFADVNNRGRTVLIKREKFNSYRPIVRLGTTYMVFDFGWKVDVRRAETAFLECAVWGIGRAVTSTEKRLEWLTGVLDNFERQLENYIKDEGNEK